MHTRSFLLFVLFAISSVAAFAQNGIRVSVLEKASDEPVILAYVNVYDASNKSLQITEQTNELGIAVVNPTNYPCIIEVVSLGYEGQTQTFYRQPASGNMAVFLTKKFGSINEIVVTGNTQPMRLKDALSSYQIISRAQIDAMGAVTLTDALKNQINIQLSNDNILGSSLQMQGMSGNKVKILLDGVPVNGREGGNINLSQINMNNVERIEIVQGPMNVAYGTDALGGVINVITRKDNKPFGVRLNTYYETVGKYNIDGSITFKLKNRHQFTAGGGRNYFQGWKYLDTPLSKNGATILVQRYLFFKPNEQYLGNLGYTYNAGSGFTLRFSSDYVKEKVTNRGMLEQWDAFLGGYAWDEYYNTQRLMNRVSLNGKLGKTGSWISQNAYNIYARTRTRYKMDMVTLQETLSGNQQDHDTSRFDDIVSRSSYSNKAGIFNYTVGYDVNMSFAKSGKISGDGDTSLHDYALYGSVSAPLIKDKLTAQAGLRGSYNTSYNAPLTPSLNLMYTPRKNVQIRGSYSKGFRSPSLKELYLTFVDQNHQIFGSPELKAEISDHIQASASYQVYEQRGNYLQFIVTGYYNDVKNGIALMSMDPANQNNTYYRYTNVLRQRNAIATIQADGQFKNLYFQLAYSRNYTQRQEGMYDAFNTGEATATVQYNVKKYGLSFSIIEKYTEPRPIISTSIDGTPGFRGTQSDFSMLDLTAEKKLFKNYLQLIVGVKNALDVTQVAISGIPVVNSAHGGASNGLTGGFLPRSFFTSMRWTID